MQLAFCGYLLVDQCLTCQIVAKIMENNPRFQDQVKEPEELYTLMETGENDLESMLQSDCICQIDKALTLKRNELADDYASFTIKHYYYGYRSNVLWVFFDISFGDFPMCQNCPTFHMLFSSNTTRKYHKMFFWQLFWC